MADDLIVPQRENRLGIVLALVAATVSGASVWLNAQVVARVDTFGDPGTYTTAKNLVAGTVVLLLAVVASSTGSRHGITRPSGRATWTALIAVAVIGGAVPFLLFFEGLAASGAPADAQLVHKAGLLAFVALLAPALLRERTGPLQLAGVGSILLGYWILSVDLGGVSPGRGLALVLVAALCWSVESVIDRWLLAGLSPATVAVARLFAGSLVLVVIGVFNGDTARLADLGPGAWGWVLLTGVVLACYTALWLYALANATALDVTAVLALAAPVTAIVAVVTEGSAIPDPVGLGVVACGAVLVASAASRRKSTPVPSPR